jgi:hypothetical protein
MEPLAITVLFLLALGGFCFLAWRKLAVVVALQPEVRWDQPGKRLRKLLSLGFLQSRMIAGEPNPGVMHTVIFLGFMTLLVRKVQLLVIGYSPTFVYPGALGRGPRSVQGRDRGRGIFVGFMNSASGTATASSGPPALAIGAGTSPCGKTKPLPGS